MTEPGEELHRTIQVACVKCGLQKRITGIPTQGIPRQQGAEIHGPSFFPQNRHPTCIKCGSENFSIVSKPPDDGATAAPAPGWAGPAGGTKITR